MERGLRIWPVSNGFLFLSDREGLKMREKVFFLEDVFEDDGGKVYLLDPEVKTLELEYYDIPEDETAGGLGLGVGL